MAGISQDLIDTLTEVSKHTHDSLELIQEKLLVELSVVLGEDAAESQQEPFSFTMRRTKWRRWCGLTRRAERTRHDTRSIILALHTLQVFELQNVNLFDYITRHVMPYVDDPNETIRCNAVSVACKLLLQKDKPMKHTALFMQEYHEVQKLISVGLSDRDSSVRACLLNSLDERFDPYLLQVAQTRRREA